MKDDSFTLAPPATTWQDQRRIDLARAYEVRDWCKNFRCSKEELHDAVKAVGPSAQKVRDYLRAGA